MAQEVQSHRSPSTVLLGKLRVVGHLTARGTKAITGAVEAGGSGTRWRHEKNIQEDRNWKRGPSHEGGNIIPSSRGASLTIPCCLLYLHVKHFHPTLPLVLQRPLCCLGGLALKAHAIAGSSWVLFVVSISIPSITGPGSLFAE